MIILDYRDRRPLYEQIVERLEELILSGVLKKDDQLPSVRSLAMDLSINPNTIQRAYSELERAGYTYSVKGKGNFVAENQDALRQKRMEFLKRTEALVNEAVLLQIGEAEFCSFIHEHYKKGGQQDD